MTTVGHSLVGLCCGAITIPRRWHWQGKTLAFSIFVLLASVPDLPIPAGWGHIRYDVSHSVFSNLAAIGVVTLLLLALPRVRETLGWPVIAGAAAAWLSHMLLDSFYSHGLGVRIFWPLSDATLRLPIPWFHVVTDRETLTLETLRIFGVEAACYGALLTLCVLWRRSRFA